MHGDVGIQKKPVGAWYGVLKEAFDISHPMAFVPVDEKSETVGAAHSEPSMAEAVLQLGWRKSILALAY